MKRNLILLFALLLALTLGFKTAAAQFTITIPKIPKIKKPKADPPKPQPPPPTADDDRSSGQNTPSKPEPVPAEPAEPAEPAPTEEEKMDFRLKYFLEEIAEAQKAVVEYHPDEMLYLISSTRQEWMWRAVSMRLRNEWATGWLNTPYEKKRFAEALDALAAAAAKQLPNYKMNPKAYPVRNAAEEKMMKTVFKDPASFVFHYIGLEKATWLIDKNEYGLPTSRFKRGAVWVRNTKSDHPYCYITYVNIIQDYAGGGTYGASYPYYVSDEMVGCPAGK